MYDISVIVILVIMVLFIVYNFYTDYTDWINTGNTFAEGFNDYGKGMDNVGNRGRQLLPLIDYGWKGFKKINGKFKQITETKDYIYAINLQNEIYKCKKPCDGSWEKVEGTLKQISTSPNDIWGVNESNKIFKKERTWAPFSFMNWLGRRFTRWGNFGKFGNWKEVGGNLKQVSSTGKGYVWGVNEKNQVFNCKKPCKPWAGDGPLTLNKSEPLYKRPANTYKPQNKGNNHSPDAKLKKGEGNCRIKYPQNYKVSEKRIVPEKCNIGHNESYVQTKNIAATQKWIPPYKIYINPIEQYVAPVKRWIAAQYRTDCRNVFQGYRYIPTYIINWWFIKIRSGTRKISRGYKRVCSNRKISNGYNKTIRNGYYKTIKAGYWKTKRAGYYAPDKPARTERQYLSRWVDGDGVTNPSTKAFCDKEYPGWVKASTENGWVPVDLKKMGRCANYKIGGSWTRDSANVSSLEECANAFGEEGVFSYNGSNGCLFTKKSGRHYNYSIQGIQSGCKPEYWGGWKFYKNKRGKVAKKNAVVYKTVDKPGWKPPKQTSEFVQPSPPPPPSSNAKCHEQISPVNITSRGTTRGPGIRDFYSTNISNGWISYNMPQGARATNTHGLYSQYNKKSGRWDTKRNSTGFSGHGIESVRVPEGCRVALYRDLNTSGYITTLGPGGYDKYDLNKQGARFIKSIKIDQNPIPPPQAPEKDTYKIDKIIMKNSAYGCPRQTFTYVGKQGRYNNVWKGDGADARYLVQEDDTTTTKMACCKQTNNCSKAHGGYFTRFDKYNNSNLTLIPEQVLSETDYKNKYGNKNWSPDAMCEDGLTCSKPNGGKQRVPGVYWGLDAANQWSENANVGFCYDKNDTQYQRNGESKKGFFHGLPYNNGPNDTQQWDQEHRHYFWVSMNPNNLPLKKKKYSVKILNNDWNTIKKRVQRYCSNAKLVKKESGIYTFKCMGHENNILPDWKYHTGVITQVSGGDKFIWGVNSNNNTIWRKPINGSGNWKQIKGNAKFINANNKNIVYIINNKDEVFKCEKPCDDGNWEKIELDIKGSKDSLKATQVSGYKHVVWATNKLNDIFKTVTENVLPFGQTKLGKCEGDCKTDNDCQKGLKCYERKNGGDIPDGCAAGGPGDIPTYGYCYDPAWNYVPPAPPDEKEVCTTEESCKKVAIERGLNPGTEEQSSDSNAEGFVNKEIDFAGNYATKGLYSYKGGKYKGMAFFGKGGTPQEMSAPFPKDSNKYRPEDLKEGEEYEQYYCSSGAGERLGKWDAKSKKDCITQCKGKYPSRKGHKCFTDPFPPPATWKAGGTGDCPTGCKRPKCITGNCKDVIIDGVIYKSCTGSCSNVEGAGVDGGCKYDIDCSEKKCGVVYFNNGDKCDASWQKKLSRTAFDTAVGKMFPEQIKNLPYGGPLKDDYKNDPVKEGEKTIFNAKILKQVLANKNLIPSDINLKIEKQGNYIRIGKNLMNDVSYIRNVSLPDIGDEDYESLGRIIAKIKRTNAPPNNNIKFKLTNAVNNILTPSLKSKSTTGMYGDNSNALMSGDRDLAYNSIWNLNS